MASQHFKVKVDIPITNLVSIHPSRRMTNVDDKRGWMKIMPHCRLLCRSETVTHFQFWCLRIRFLLLLILTCRISIMSCAFRACICRIWRLILRESRELLFSRQELHTNIGDFGFLWRLVCAIWIRVLRNAEYALQEFYVDVHGSCVWVRRSGSSMFNCGERSVFVRIYVLRVLNSEFSRYST